MKSRVLHVSDIHAGHRETPALAAALTRLVEEVEPEAVLVTGDLAHRGLRRQLEQAHALLASLGRPVIAVPGNHDIPYTLPARVTRPWRSFDDVFGSTRPVYRSETLVICGLNSVRPWRHQGGRLTTAQLATVAGELGGAGSDALRVVAFHHHLAGAPWRASRKFPLKYRDRALAALAAAGAELIAGGHIHQCQVTERREFEVLPDHRASLVLATAPGLGRPRPHRAGEAQGALVHEWDSDRLEITTHILAGDRFVRTARREFPRQPSAGGE